MPLLKVIHRSLVDSPQKGPAVWNIGLCFVASWPSCCIDSRVADDLRCHETVSTSLWWLSIAKSWIWFLVIFRYIHGCWLIWCCYTKICLLLSGATTTTQHPYDIIHNFYASFQMIVRQIFGYLKTNDRDIADMGLYWYVKTVRKISEDLLPNIPTCNGLPIVTIFPTI